MKNDNIKKGFETWATRFIVAQRLKKQKELLNMNSFYVLDNPVDAYILFEELKRKTSNPYHDNTFEWILVDSFGKNALSFCKQKAQSNAVVE